MIELEKKIMLTKGEYDYLLSKFGKDKPIIKQTNFYFDTEDLSMNQRNITCRIRLKDGKCHGTMKSHIANTNQSIETEMAVRNGIYDNAFIDLGLKLQGELVTERCIIVKNSICEVALDKNDYLGYTDYELEIEYSPNCENEANSILQTLLNTLIHYKKDLSLLDHTTPTNNTFSKSNRFFARRAKK